MNEWSSSTQGLFAGLAFLVGGALAILGLSLLVGKLQRRSARRPRALAFDPSRCPPSPLKSEMHDWQPILDVEALSVCRNCGTLRVPASTTVPNMACWWYYVPDARMDEAGGP